MSFVGFTQDYGRKQKQRRTETATATETETEIINVQHPTLPHATCHIQHELLLFRLRSMEAAAGIEQFARPRLVKTK